jgi:hypothetical protein
MSDAGKVLLGTDGNPLLSADGKIVFADDLYPMWFNPSLALYGRRAEGYDMAPPNSCPAADVWNAEWFAGTDAETLFEINTNGAGESSYVQHTGMILTFPDNDVVWSRTKAVKIGLNIDVVNGSFPTGMTLLITAALNPTDGIMPDGVTVRDSWTTAKTYTAAPDEAFWITIDTGGVKPDTIGIAAVWDVETCSLFSVTGVTALTGQLYANQQKAQPTLTCQAVYNLAT